MCYRIKSDGFSTFRTRRGLRLGGRSDDLFVTLNLIQGRIVEQTARVGIIKTFRTRRGLRLGGRSDDLFVTLNLLQGRIVEQTARVGIIKTFRTRRGLRLEFGLFGRSENSSFSSTLRAWFAIAHHRPTENPTGVTKKTKPLRDVPHPSFPQVGEGGSIERRNQPPSRNKGTKRKC